MTENKVSLFNEITKKKNNKRQSKAFVILTIKWMDQNFLFRVAVQNVSCLNANNDRACVINMCAAIPSKYLNLVLVITNSNVTKN